MNGARRLPDGPFRGVPFVLKDLGAGRTNSRGHDGPELYESAPLLKFLLAD